VSASPSGPFPRARLQFASDQFKGATSIAAGVNPERAFTRLLELKKDVEPLLELAESICHGLQRKPLDIYASIECYPGPEVIEGMPVEKWLSVRKMAALEIQPKTAKVRLLKAQPAENDP